MLSCVDLWLWIYCVLWIILGLQITHPLGCKFHLTKKYRRASWEMHYNFSFLSSFTLAHIFFSSFILDHKITPVLLFAMSWRQKKSSNSPCSNNKARKSNGKLNSKCFFCNITLSNQLKSRENFFYYAIWFLHQ